LRAEVVGAMNRDVKVLAGIAVFVLVAGVGWLVFGPSRPPTIPPVLGWGTRVAAGADADVPAAPARFLVEVSPGEAPSPHSDPSWPPRLAPNFNGWIAGSPGTMRRAEEGRIRSLDVAKPSWVLAPHECARRPCIPVAPSSGSTDRQL
jgi:hypothetical protein